MAQGNIFFIKSHMNGKVLDVAGGHGGPGSQVIMWDQKWADHENQLWYEDPVTGTIRTQVSHHCLEIDGGNNLSVNEFDEDNENQKWRVDGNCVRNRENGRVLDIADHNEHQGARVCAWDYHGSDNQLWYFEYQPARCFFIRSQMNGKVLDIKGHDAEPGAKVITYEQNDIPTSNQMWYQDNHGFIRSAMNDLVWDSSEGKIMMQEYEEGNEGQMWFPDFNENKIINAAEPDQAIDIKGAKDKDKAKIVSWEFHGGDNQKWEFEYIL